MLSEEVKYLMKSISNIHVQGRKRNILINATPRGGSTWLMETIASQPMLKFFDEPFNIRRRNVQRTGKFSSWEDLMPGTADENSIIEYVNNLARNKYRFMNPPPFRRNYSAYSNRIVFKIHELEFMMERLSSECDLDIVYLVRHPIANSLSRSVVPRIEQFLQSPYYRERYLDPSQQAAVTDLAAKGSRLQQFAVSWCYENIDALNSLKRSNWIVISYEEMVLNTRKCCELLAHRLQLKNLNRLLKQAGEPAVNIGLSGKETHEILGSPDSMERKKKLVTRWQDQVSETESRSVFDVLDVFGIDDYSLDRLVASDRILNFSDTRELLK